MDLNEFWQENKRFVVTLASGAIVFVIGSMLVNSFFRAELTKHERDARSTSDKLKNEPMFGTGELERALRQNEGLQASITQLAQAVDFQARPRYRIDAERGPATNQYFAAVAGTREELLKLAGRANLRIPEDLGLPALSPTRELEIQKYLEALDLVDRAARMALDAGVERVDKIEIKLDPKLASRGGVGEIEETRVAFTLSGRPGPLVQLLLASQEPAREGAAGLTPLLVERPDLVPARGKADEAVLEVTFLVVRLHAREADGTQDNGT